ncbi:hypothetical protein WS62_23330 [Burkholderia sp. ABCPW 14]|uniref:hypothetical protein n=1 Tax=Burkholderia sp. ABCPW 14 TaxID=1637860 RepID=UPI000770BB7B|nr:hypothetical protein [Burkholderia sp. ABCPW 14]KVD82159.1 hypothetical protein WS62_23330 [Burkholderia sp. ABCPW 14]
MPINEAGRDRGERVLPKVHLQLTNAGAFPALRAGLFRGDDFSLGTAQSIRARGFLGWLSRITQVHQKGPKAPVEPHDLSRHVK